MGDLLLEGGRLPEAEKVFGRGVDALEEVARKYPKTVGYREEAASAWHSLGRLHEAAGRTHEAESAFRRCIELYEGLVAERPGRVSCQAVLACLLADCPVGRLRDPPRAVQDIRDRRDRNARFASHIGYRRHVSSRCTDSLSDPAVKGLWACETVCAIVFCIMSEPVCPALLRNWHA